MRESAYNRLVKSVMKSGKPAQAEVLSAQYIMHSRHNIGTWMDFARPWRMALRVTPEEAPPFDVELKMEIPDLMNPALGTILQVIYDPKKPDSIIVDPASVPTDPMEAAHIDAANAKRALEIEADRLPEPAEPVADPIAAAQAAARALDDPAAMRARGAWSAPAPSEDAIAGLFRAQREAVRAAMADPPPARSSSPGATEAAIEAKLAQLDAFKAAGVMDEQTYSASRQRLIDALLQ